MFRNLPFTSKRSQSKAGKLSPDLQALHLDFFCQLTYMAGIATSGISRSGLFNYSARIPLFSAKYFQRVNFVAKAFNHDYAESCRVVGDATKEPEVKALLLRLSGALASGEDISNFFEKEAEVASERYGDRYQGQVESLQKWTDAYVALIMTCAIVVVMTVVTMIIGSGNANFVLGFGLLTVLVTLGGVWMIYTAAPRENRTHSLPTKSREQNLARFLFRTSIPLGAAAFIIELFLKRPLGAALLTLGIFCLPLGFVAMWEDRKISKYEQDIGSFLRSLGGVAGATNITINEALSRIDFRSMVSLKQSVSLLFARIQAGIEARLCWDRLVSESGSELVVRSVRIFLDSISIGGEAERVGREAGIFALKIALLRGKRSTVANNFMGLVAIMHIVMVTLVLFIYQTMMQFSTMVQNILPQGLDVPGAPTFGVYSTSSASMHLLLFMTVGVTIVLSVANAIVIQATSGGNWFKLFFYLAITMSISGSAMLVVPKIVEIMFKMMG
jgi:archaeal flagellar protein FlaJ